MPSAPEGHAGCLTDGKRWDFLYLKPALVRKVGWDLKEEVEGYEVYESRNLGGRKKEEIKKIMGIIPWNYELTLRHPCAFCLKIFTQ